MQKVILKNTVIEQNKVSFDYDYPNEWMPFVVNLEKRLFAEYDFPLENIPESLLNVQFVTNAMLLLMFHDGVIEVDQLDKTFYEHIPQILDGYRELYPDRKINVTVNCDRLVDNTYTASTKKLMAFTGGVDATSAVATCVNEDLVLTNIWGGDIKLDNTIRHKAHAEYFSRFANKRGYEFQSVTSNFRFIYDDRFIPDKFEHDWWSAVGHAPLITVAMAPIAYFYKADKVYLASSYSVNEYKKYTIHCCNCVDIVNNIAYSSCEVEQIDPELTRIEKIQNIVNGLSPQTPDEVNLLACWNHLENSVVNCCSCEKCYRTIMNIKSCKKDPALFGFDISDDIYSTIEKFVKTHSNLSIEMWTNIQNEFKKDRRYWKKDKNLRWILSVKINHPTNIHPLWKRVYWKCREIGGKLKRKILGQKI